ncbi:MAG: DUF2339 domain-containing protein [Holophagales bacterium]|nr:DUF2339 domain-containing protein [Holophagales bacterium]
MEALLLLLAAVLVLAPVVSLVVALVTKSRLTKLEERASELERANARLEKRLVELNAGLQAPQPAPVPEATTAAAVPSPAPGSPPRAWQAPPRPPAPPVPPVLVPPVGALPPVAAPTEPRPSPSADDTDQLPIAAAPPPAPLAVPPITLPPPLPTVSALPVPRVGGAPNPHLSGPPRPTAQPRPAAPPRPPAPPAPPPKPPFDWESLVGVKLFSWIAGVMLVVAAISFLRYSIDHGWLTPPLRMAIGLLSGIALLVVCELKAARKYPVTANALDGAAIAVLFSTFFAAHALWKLIPAIPTFGLMVLVTAVAVLLSVRRDSIFIALLGLVGGFATPALLSTGEDRPFGLFGYLLLLNAGLAWVAHRKKWPVLTVLCAILTAIYQWGWVAKFLTEGKLGIAAGVFLVFPLVLYAGLALGKPESRGGEGKSPLFEGSAHLAGLLPLAFALFLAAVPAYGARFELLFGFLFLLAAGLFAVAVWRGPSTLHLAGGLATLVVFAVWAFRSYAPGAWPSILAFLALFAVFFLAAPFVAEKVGRPLEAVGLRAAYAAPLLLALAPVLVAEEPRAASPGLLFAVVFVLLALCAAYAIVREEGGVFFAGAFFALLAEAVWSAKHLTPERLLPGLALYGVFSLFYLGVPLLARRFGKSLSPGGLSVVLLFAALALLLFLAAGPVAASALWGLALLLAVLNVGLFAEGAAGRFPVATLAGVLLSWGVLAVWWMTVPLGSFLVPGLLVVLGFALVVVGGSAWVRSKTGAAEAGGPNGIHLGLVGHLFLLFVATQPALAVPPWPLLGILLVLDLALAAAAFATGVGALLAVALVLSQIVLLVLVGAAREAPWPTVTVISTLVVAGLGLLGRVLAPRSPKGGEALRAAVAQGAAAALLLGQGVALFAGTVPGRPGLALLVAAHILLAGALVVVATLEGWHGLPVVSVGVSFLAVFLWGDSGEAGLERAVSRLLFAGLLWLLFLALPPLAARRAPAARAPWVAAVLASAAFFLLGRTSFAEAGWDGFVAVLPVGIAAALALLLVALLRVEAPAARDLGRLALVAGAALAFVTIAIPLQLDKEWITIGWALEAAALAWLYTRIPHRGLLLASAGLSGVVFARLVLNEAVLSYHARSATPILNWYLYTYLVAAVALFVAARFLRGTSDELAGGGVRASSAQVTLATILLFALVNIEIADWFSAGPTLTFNLARGTSLAQDLAYTLAWAVFAVGLLAAGIAGKSRAARIAALALLVVTVLKAFLHDLGRLGGLYRVASFVGLAVSLALVAVALQKFVLAAREKE